MSGIYDNSRPVETEKAVVRSVAIAQFPDHSRLNPLIDLYRQALVSAGITVYKHSMYPTTSSDTRAEPMLSIRWLWRHRRAVQVLHFHYYQRLYQSDSPELMRTIIKLFGFTCGIIFAHLLGYRITWTAHNLFPHERRFPIIDMWARWLVTSGASVTFVDSQIAQEAVQKTFPWINRFQQVPQGHFIGVYPKGLPRKEAREELDVPQEAFVFLSFGLIRAYKGVERLIDTFIDHLAGPSCYLLIAGDPHTQEVHRTLEYLAKRSPYVRLKLGSIPDHQVETLFNACDVAVFPFSNIFTSSSVILACSLGCPVVLPKIGALPFSEQGGTFEYDPADPDGLVNAMRRSMQGDCLEEGRKAKQLVSCRDWHTIGNCMACTFEKLVVSH